MSTFFYVFMCKYFMKYIGELRNLFKWDIFLNGIYILQKIKKGYYFETNYFFTVNLIRYCRTAKI